MGAGPAQDQPQEGRSGYPEEEPPGVADEPQEDSEDKPSARRGKAERKHADTGNEDEGTATGNPRNAGS